MATRAEPVGIGPWPGGINTLSDPTAVADAEAVEITNFDIDQDGSLKSRPAFTPTATSGNRYGNRILGIYTLLNGTAYVIFTSTDNSGGNPSTNYYNLNTQTYGTITATIAATAMVQYGNKAWLVSNPNQANSGGSWDGTTFTMIPSMPKGCTACIFKDRMFIGSGDQNTTNPSYVYWSVGQDPSADWVTGPGAGSFVVSNGDGQSIRKIYSYAGSIVIFKTRSTYVYSYESDPAKGQVQIIQSTIGIDGLDCMIENESIMYVMSGGDLYSINNWVWEQLNIRVPFQFVDTHAGNWTRHCCLSAVGFRVIARYYDSYYIFNTKTRTFTLWTSTLTVDQLIKSPLIDTVTGIDSYIGGNYYKWNGGSASNRLFNFKDAITAADSENYTATVKTKAYSFNVPYSFKRLMWWGIDLLARAPITVTAIPIAYGIPVKWNQLPPRKWLDMPPGTWGAPLDISISVGDSADIKNALGKRMFVRFIKSLRFRQIQWVISSNLDATTATSPLQIYSVTAYIVNKQLVPAKIN